MAPLPFPERRDDGTIVESTIDIADWTNDRLVSLMRCWGITSWEENKASYVASIEAFGRDQSLWNQPVQPRRKCKGRITSAMRLRARWNAIKAKLDDTQPARSDDTRTEDQGQALAAWANNVDARRKGREEAAAARHASAVPTRPVSQDGIAAEEQLHPSDSHSELPVSSNTALYQTLERTLRTALLHPSSSASPHPTVAPDMYQLHPSNSQPELPVSSNTALYQTLERTLRTALLHPSSSDSPHHTAAPNMYQSHTFNSQVALSLTRISALVQTLEQNLRPSLLPPSSDDSPQPTTAARNASEATAQSVAPGSSRGFESSPNSFPSTGQNTRADLCPSGSGHVSSNAIDPTFATDVDPTTSPPRTYSLDLGDKTIYFRAEDIPLPPSFSYGDIDKLDCWWDNSRRDHTLSPLLTIRGVGVPIAYWPSVYRYKHTVHWTKIKQKWHSCKALVKEYRRLGKHEFEVAYGANDKPLPPTSVLKALLHTRKSTDQDLADRAMREYGELFSAYFSYRTGGHIGPCVMKNPRAIARRCLRLEREREAAGLS